MPVSKLVVLACVLVASAGLGLAYQVVPFQLDDAYITYRYAAHFAEGDGIVFNRGGEWVEGFSSPLWFLALASLATLFGSESLPSCGRWLGVASFLLVLGLTWRIAAHGETDADTEPRRGWSTFVPLALVALSPAITYYAVTGFEMLLFLAVVLAFAGAIARRLPLAWGLAAGAVSAWVRPEAGWLPVMLVAQLLGERRRAQIVSRRTLVLLAPVVAGGIALVCLRLVLFGEMLPNTFYAKPSVVFRGIAYMLVSLAEPWLGGAVTLGFLGAVVGGRLSGGFFAAGVSWFAAAVLEGGDWMPKGRLLLPALGLMALSAGGIAAPRGVAAKWLARKPKTYGVVVAVGLCGVLAIGVRASLEQAQEGHNSLRGPHYAMRLFREWLTQAGADSVALVDIGVIGYRTNLEIFDLAGLTDSTVGRSDGLHLDKSFDLGYLFDSRRPDVIALRLARSPPVRADRQLVQNPHWARSKIESRIMRARRLASDYRLHHAILATYRGGPDKGLLVYVRRDFRPAPDAAALLPPAPEHGVATLYVPWMKGPLHSP